MASGPITSWEIDGETVETVSDFIFMGSKITADGDCSHEIKRRLHLGKKVMTNLDSIFKSRDITLPTKVCLVKSMVFPVVMLDDDSEYDHFNGHEHVNSQTCFCISYGLSPLTCLIRVNLPEDFIANISHGIASKNKHSL